MQKLLTNYRYSLPIGAALLAGIAWLAFGYFGVHTLFIDNEVDEALPTFDRGARIDDTTTEVTTDDDPAIGAAATIGGQPVTGGDTVIGDDITIDGGTGGDDTTEVAHAEIVVEADGTFESLGRYSTSGVALVLGDGSGQRFLRFEDFATTNGPDLNVYLVNSSTGDTSDYVDLGDLSGNIGNQNYEIPDGVDLSVYDTVTIWCVRFGVGFGQASLQAVSALS